jgi:hypothetical protein
MAILKPVASVDLEEKRIIISLEVIHIPGDGVSKAYCSDDKYKQLSLKAGMKFECLKGTTIVDLFFAAIMKNSLLVRYPDLGTMWYATARVESFGFDTMFQREVLRTQNAMYLVHTAPAPKPSWLKRKFNWI